MDDENLRVSPAVLLELELLYEIGRLQLTPQKLVGDLSQEIGVQVCNLPFAAVVEQALSLSWVRDPFDRLIVAQAKANDAPLITKDQVIRLNYRRAVW